MDRQQKIDRIYEVIGGFNIPCKNCGCLTANSLGECGCSYDSRCQTEYCMIGDTLDWINDNVKLNYNFFSGNACVECGGVVNIMENREDKRKPVEEQSDKLLDHLIKLMNSQG